MTEPTPTSRSHSAEDAKRVNAPPSPWLRFALCLVTIALSGTLFYFLGNRLVSQIYYTKANSAFKANYYWIAVRHLKKAIDYQPNDIIFWRKLAETYYTIGEKEVSTSRSLYLRRQGQEGIFGSESTQLLGRCRRHRARKG